MKSTEKEILQYYNEFYENDDFSYYPENITNKFLKSILATCNIKDGAKILDVGCGTGYYTYLFTKLGFECTGIDYSETAIRKAKEKYQNAKYEVIDATKLPYDMKSFDLIFLFGCTLINHVQPEKINDYLIYINQFLKENGALVYIGGSNLKENYTGKSEWYNHSFSELKKIALYKNKVKNGPFLSHFRIISLLGRYGYSWIINLFLRSKIFTFKRMVLIFFKPGK